MIINKPIIKCKFIRRPNRFQGYVLLNGEETLVHVPNTGRCKEILIPGCTVLLRKEDGPLRKTQYDLIGGYKGEKLINIDSQIPNKVVYEALKHGKIKELVKFTNIEREKTFGNSRFDFKLNSLEGEECYLEVKGVTLEENGRAMFPDAPTERGTKHLKELIEVKKAGKEAAVLFLIQLDNVKYFEPHYEMDKNFSDALRLAYKNGVKVLAYECSLGENFITLSNEIPVKL